MEQEIEKFGRLTESARQALRQETPGIEAALRRIMLAADETWHACESCQLKIKHSWRDAQLASTLQSMRAKLRRWEQEACAEPDQRGLPR